MAVRHPPAYRPFAEQPGGGGGGGGSSMSPVAIQQQPAILQDVPKYFQPSPDDQGSLQVSRTMPRGGKMTLMASGQGCDPTGTILTPAQRIQESTVSGIAPPPISSHGMGFQAA
ncbi:hypothetical protein BO71DRAFT_429628 [Aspergillus ellipticus CBS 707.79]|uniref:Uncharacterized protein n=1 Tax=Aspergillus ellipticus CBS 707.79 TaxID=1448320 RepID=A0A319EUI8_9EURO|nr:hypothetical protein BO71DRAFT_429628 [Aspergillus ellipticus CBS 707.79]